MRFSTALSQHPVPAEATAEVVGQILEQGPDRRDLAVLFCSAHHLDAFAAIAGTVRALLEPGRFLGATAMGVIGGDREVEEGPAVSLWVADLGGVPEAVRLTAVSTPVGVAVQGLPRVEAGAGQAVVLIADPFSLPVPEVLDVIAAGTGPGTGPGSGATGGAGGAGDEEDGGTGSGPSPEDQAAPGGVSGAPGAPGTPGGATDPIRPAGAPGASPASAAAGAGGTAGARRAAATVPVVGGLASAGMAPGGNRLALDDDVYVDGAVGVVLEGVDAVVSQGCRPVGSPMIVTRAEGNQLVELAGRSAVSRLEEVASQVTADERALLASQGVHLGIVADEHQVAFGRGDFLVRNVVGADRVSGALSVGAQVAVGTTVQFHVRDAASADEDLRALLAGRRAGGALVFTCNGRGRNLFGTPHHDARLVSEATAAQGVAGMFCAGEMGPVGARSFLHGYTACLVLLGDGAGDGAGPGPDQPNPA